MSYTDNDCNEGEDEMDISEVECESGDAGIPIKCADAPAFDDDKKLGAAYYTEDKCSGTPVKADIDPTKCYKSSSAKGQADALVGLMYATQVVMASKFGGIDPTAGTYNAKLMTDCVRAAPPRGHRFPQPRWSLIPCWVPRGTRCPRWLRTRRTTAVATPSTTSWQAVRSPSLCAVARSDPCLHTADKCNELEGSSYNLACGSDGSPAPRATATIGLLLCAALAFFGIF